MNPASVRSVCDHAHADRASRTRSVLIPKSYVGYCWVVYLGCLPWRQCPRLFGSAGRIERRGNPLAPTMRALHDGHVSRTGEAVGGWIGTTGLIDNIAV
jgi:hypothetical protein